MGRGCCYCPHLTQEGAEACLLRVNRRQPSVGPRYVLGMVLNTSRVLDQIFTTLLRSRYSSYPHLTDAELKALIRRVTHPSPRSL